MTIKVTNKPWVSRQIGCAIILMLLALVPALPVEGTKKRVRFARGSSSAVLEGTVLRGDRDKYLLGARAGQTMTVRVTALEDNAVFQIYQPDRKTTLDGAGETDDAKEWEGELPATGDYLIVVGGTRGNASYKLEVAIK